MLRCLTVALAMCAFVIDNFAQVSFGGSPADGCQNELEIITEINIIEGALDDFNLPQGVPQTLIFQPTSGSFSAGVGTVSFYTPDVNTNIVVTTSQITVTLTANSATTLSELDDLRIFNIELITTTPELVQIRYTGGTASVNGLAPSNVVASVDFHATPLGANGSTISCSMAQINFDLNLSITNGVSSTFMWFTSDNPNTEGETVGEPAGSSSISDSPAISGGSAPSELLEYTVTPRSIVGNCVGLPFTVDVTVEQQPLAPALNTSICSTVAASIDLQNHIDTQGNSIPANFSWSTGDNENVLGESTSPQSAPVITDILTNITASKQNIVYLVTASSLGANCSSGSFSVVVEVNEISSAANALQSICSDVAQNFDISAFYEANDNGVMATSFHWRATDNASVTGETHALQNTSLIPDVVSNPTNVSHNVTYIITPNSYNGCIGTAFNYTLTVNPVPTIVVTNPSTVISSTASTNISLSSPVAGASFLYTVSAPTEISGASAGSESPIVQTLTNATTLPQLVTYTINVVANGCSGEEASVVLTVRGDPTMNQNDSLALVALYNALNGTSWSNQTHWLSGPADTWQGVNVSGERLISLALPGNSLSGALPPGFFNAPFLTLLDLSDNNISGPLPAEISSLTALQILDIQNNQLTGDLPNSLFSLVELTQLYLRGNDFTGSIPAVVNNLTNLQTLQAEGLPMDGPIPPEVFSLTSLVNLGLSGKINGPLPASIGGLTSLFTFNCDSCAITSLPSQIASLSGLVSIRLQNNKLETLPDLSALPLTYLDVSKNSLTFEALEPHVAIPTFVYVPQDTVGLASTILLQTTTPHTFTARVGGSANQYAWKKDGVMIPSESAEEFTIAAPVFEDEGVYEAEITSALVNGLTLKTAPITARVSSLKRDSLTLVQIYDSNNGTGWAGVTGWTENPLTEWTGVTITSNRVTALDLANRGLTGELPADFTDLRSLETADLSGNALTGIPAMVLMDALTNLNIASNNITFGSLEQNSAILGKITYSSQNVIGIASQDSIPAETTVELFADVTGANNIYQWKLNNLNVANGNASTFEIASLNRQTMGEYFCEVTNTVVPGLMLQTAKRTVLATAELSGIVKVSESDPATKGNVTLLRIPPAGAFEKVRTEEIQAEGNYIFPKVVLGDYQIVAFVDTIEHERAIPSYFRNTIFWEEADTLFVQNDRADLDITTTFKPGPPSGQGVISGIVQEEEAGSGGRPKIPKPVRGAGVSARRVQNTGRGKEEILTLISYRFTNEEGEFSLTNLPHGNYRLNIQYPGLPMDENSFINFTIGTGLQSEVKVEALADKGVINVRQLIITAIWSKEEYHADVFPNPANDVIYIKFGGRCSYRDIGIFDASGKRIRNASAAEDNTEINVLDLPKGLYFINIIEKDSLVKSLHVIIE